MKNSCRIIAGFAVAALISSAFIARGQSAPERAAAVKASLAASHVVLKQYEWVETTVVSVKGSEKSRQMSRCYYGADGGVQRVPLTAAPPPEKKRGLRGRIAARKQEEMTDYMKQAVALVKSYIPPKPELIQAAKDSGRISLDIVVPGQRARLNLRDYLKRGDTLGVELDLTSNRLLGVTVMTHLDSKDDAVNLQARLGTLADGTTYTEGVTLSAPSKQIKVQVDNSGYRKTGH